MSEVKIIIEKEGVSKTIECDEYWIFSLKEEGEQQIFTDACHGSLIFRSCVQNQATIFNLTTHLKRFEENKEKEEEND